MKKRDNSLPPEKVILNDKEAREAIRSLIAVMHERGYLKTDAVKAIGIEWRTMFPEKDITYQFTDQEMQFILKADKFIEEYADLIVKLHDSNRNTTYKCSGNKPYTQCVLDRYKKFFCAGYCAFCREESFRQQSVFTYAYKLMGEKNSYGICNYEVRMLGNMFKDMHYPTEEGERPTYSSNILEEPSENTLSCNKSYHDFLNEYKFNRTDLAECLMPAIWFIQTYY